MNDYELLLQEREEFENMIYDLLVTPLFIPDSFWDPVVVCLSSEQIENMVITPEEVNCSICKDTKDSFHALQCCNAKMCKDCLVNWFTISVFCPYCKRDQR